MSYEILNLMPFDVTVDGVVWPANGKRTVAAISQSLIYAIETKGWLQAPIDVTPLGGLADLASTLNDVTDSSGGTAATVTDGARTIAAVTDNATAANAIATLAAELDNARTTIAALVARCNILQDYVERVEAERLLVAKSNRA